MKKKKPTSKALKNKITLKCPFQSLLKILIHYTYK